MDKELWVFVTVCVILLVGYFYFMFIYESVKYVINIIIQ